jgi:hypothetical protein
LFGINKAASIFSLFCGVTMLIVWAILLVAGNVTELRSSPFQAVFLLGVEFLTAISLLVGGYGLLAGKRWGVRADVAALACGFPTDHPHSEYASASGNSSLASHVHEF